ncbi:MAG: nitrogen fixation protein NifZ [Aquificaceae bacterium]|nr:nitrogen fixation protein NifZ [Aquificaceae bacterium]
MEKKFEVGNAVKTKKKIRNDGTFPGVPWGDLLLDKGEEGVVMDVGLFLMEKVVYTVYFPKHGILVGCLEHELEAVDEKTGTFQREDNGA